MLKDIKFILQKLFIPGHLTLKKRILRSIKSRIEREYNVIPLLCNKDYLSIDVEGLDFHILMNINFQKYNITINSDDSHGE